MLDCSPQVIVEKLSIRIDVDCEGEPTKDSKQKICDLSKIVLSNRFAYMECTSVVRGMFGPYRKIIIGILVADSDDIKFLIAMNIDGKKPDPDDWGRYRTRDIYFPSSCPIKGMCD
jgi:hypothetical protein